MPPIPPPLICALLLSIAVTGLREPDGEFMREWVDLTALCLWGPAITN